ncbi:MAG: Asp-tRNA(Asn)/Glu-tRNA(Gln) amidotransferase subunit GatA [Clostridia bacterium]|nr:Asp-tRNA(Asn)/Glu-tRNA(Gln) amidotransferase subunit GatA [Clostridia bacterium]
MNNGDNNNSLELTRELVKSGARSAEQIASEYLGRINASGDNCFISVLDAMAQARDIDDKARSGFDGKLLGAVVAIKDNMRYIGSVTTCGSAILTDKDTEDCEVVKRLKAAGAVIVGKTNMDEFAMGSSNATSAYGNVLNPLDRTRVPGGSSGGSAAAVASGLCMAALGSDTGGSIRQPASYCGVVGLKPTLGSIDGSGMYALSQDMDQIGPITKTVDENRLMFEVLSGKAMEKAEVKGLTVGLVREFEHWYTEDTKRVIQRAKEVLSSIGCRFVEVSLPSADAAFATYRALGNTQSANNLRNIGTAQERTDKLGIEVKKRILIGEYVLAHPEIAERAKRVKNKIISEFAKAFNLCDIIVSPSAPSVAFKFTDDRNNKEIVYSDIFTQPPSIAGLPALSVPCVKGESGLPIGVQLVGKKNAENVLFEIGKLFE